MLKSLLALCIALAPGIVSASELSDTAVEKVLGVSGVHHEPNKYLKTDTTYRSATGTSLFTLRVAPSGDFASWKVTQAANSEAVAGVGLEAFTHKTLGGLCARSRVTAVCVSSVPFPGRPALTRQQLIDLVTAAF